MFASLLMAMANMLILKLSSQYGDIPVAAMGIVKKTDMLPLHLAWDKSGDGAFGGV